MIKTYRFKDLRVSYLEGFDVARELFEDFQDGKIPKESISVLSNGTTGPVYRIEYCGQTYILKHDLRRKHRFEFLVQSFFVGSNATRLLRKLDRAKFPFPGGAPAARIFLSADKIRCRCVLESFVLMEFIRGKEIYAIPDGRVAYGTSCAEIVRWLHACDLVHGDVHCGNFMVENETGRVRVIDISGKRATAYQRAFDKIRVEEHFGVRLDEKQGFWERLVRAHLRYRAQRKLKKKK